MIGGVSVSATCWLAATAMLCGFAFIAVVRNHSVWSTILALVMCAAVSLPGAFLPLGYASPFAPPNGTYQLISAMIQMGRGMWVVVSIDDEPRLFFLKWDQAMADALQLAMNNVDGGGSSALTFGDNGLTYDNRPPVDGDYIKSPAAEPVI